LLVNPYDTDGTADTIYRAFCMDPEERRQRMMHLRTEIRRNDVHRWLRRFVDSAEDDD
jgi:trehalose 6-phosphate synthase